jgi:hypothetical protein
MNEPRQDRDERVATAREKLRKAMGRLVVVQVADHDEASAEESASGPRGDEGPEAGAGEDGAETEGRGTSTGQSRSTGQ